MVESSLGVVEGYCNAIAASTGKRCRNRTKGCPSGFCSLHRGSGHSSAQSPKARQRKDCTEATLASTSQKKRLPGSENSACSPHKPVNTDLKAEPVRSTEADATNPLAVPAMASNVVDKKPSVNATMPSMIEERSSIRSEDLHVLPASAPGPSVLPVKQDVLETIGIKMEEAKSSEADGTGDLEGSAAVEKRSFRTVSDTPSKFLAGQDLQQSMGLGTGSMESAGTGTSEKSASSAQWKARADCKRSQGAMEEEMPWKRKCMEWSLPVGAPVFHGCPHASLRDPFFEECASVEGRMLKQKYQCAEGCEQCKRGWRHILPSYWRSGFHSSSRSNVDTLSSRDSFGDGKDKMKNAMQNLETQPSKRRKDWHNFLPSFFSRGLSSSSLSSTEVLPSQSTYEDEHAEAKTSKQDPETRPSKRRRLFGNWFSQ